MKLEPYTEPSVDKTPIDPAKRLQTTLSKKVTAESQVCENAADQHLDRCDIRIKKLK